MEKRLIMTDIWVINSKLDPETKMEAVEQILRSGRKHVAIFEFPLINAAAHFIGEKAGKEREIKDEMCHGGLFGLMPDLIRPDLPTDLQQWLRGDPVYL